VAALAGAFLSGRILAPVSRIGWRLEQAPLVDKSSA
jgi:hypothetical protein